LQSVATAAAAYLGACAQQLRRRRPAPGLVAVAAAFEAYNAEVVAIREQGLTRSLSAQAAERFFALGFAFEQMRQNFRDLERCVSEWAENSRA
jgi:hypothetical protein